MTIFVPRVVKVLLLGQIVLLMAGSICAAAGDEKSSAALASKSSGDQNNVLNILQSDDEIAVRSLQAKEIADKSFRIDQNGEANFPLVGRIHLAGETIRQAEILIAERLKKFYVDPDIALNISVFHQEPVSVIGAVGAPGVHQIHGQTSLLDVLSSAGGIRGDAGPVAKITRQSRYGKIPHPSAHDSSSGDSVAQVDLKSLLEARNTVENIEVQPHDLISIPPAEVVYVVGNVKRAGGFPLGGKPNLSVLQALSLAEGLDPRAAPKRSRILRRGSEPQAERTEIAVDVQKILAGQAQDVILRPNDILFIPNSAAKTVSTRTIETIIQIGTGMVIYARP